MKRPVENSEQEVLAGLVERVTFHSLESGFCVLRLKARGHRDFVTTIGHAAMISAGEWVTASGDWVNDRTHGLQFRARFLKTSAPTSLDGIEKYLARLVDFQRKAGGVVRLAEQLKHPAKKILVRNDGFGVTPV